MSTDQSGEAERADDADIAAVERMLDKLRAFVADLDDRERAALAALFGPGVALAHRDTDDGGDDVEGFATTWEPDRLPEHLAAAVRNRNVRVTGL